MKPLIHRGLSGAKLTLVVFMMPSLAAAGPDDLRATSSADAIGGGEKVEACAWPTAAYLTTEDGQCTGTLVHPELILYAAHCGLATRIQFGDRQFARTEEVAIDECMVNPNYGPGIGNPGIDWAFCRLAKPVFEIPVTPISYGCESDIIRSGQSIALVGFGQPMAGEKKWVTVQIGQVNAGQFSSGGSGKGACPGDSGGPAFAQLPDDTWHTVGIASINGGTCGTANIHARADGAAQWVESESGIDITPCHDSDGRWNPSTLCRGFYTGGPNGSGSWYNWCEDTPSSGFVSICGDPRDANPDAEPPSVQIVGLEDGQYFPGDEAEIQLDVEADDADGWGVAMVRMIINGDEHGEDRLAPYTFGKGTFPAGLWALEAVAEDWATNEGRSGVIRIGIGQKVLEVSPDTDTDTDGMTPDGEGTSSTDTDGETDGHGQQTPASGCSCQQSSSFVGVLPLWFGISLARRRT